MSGNRKRARLASLESQAKGQPANSVADGDSWQEPEFQSQPFDGSVSSTGTGSADFQPLTSIATNHSGIITSHSMLYNPLYFDISSSLPDSAISTDFVQPLSTSSTSMTFTLDPHLSQTEPLQGNTSNDDAMPISQNGSSEYMTSSEFSSTDIATSSLLENHAWDDLPPDDTVTDPLSFNDEAYVTTPGLSVIRAHVTILQRMHRNGGKIDVWNPFSVSPFYQSGAPSAAPPPLAVSLPDNYHPTALQKAVKHHPVLDLLPWPSVRSKILHILTLPMEFRPQRAKGDLPNVTMQLMLDMKDAGGGLRVWGSNPFDENNWEVGPVFFQQWWWALDSEIVKRSNQIRTQRGEDILHLKNISQ
jgi:hypothetical protein